MIQASVSLLAVLTLSAIGLNQPAPDAELPQHLSLSFEQTPERIEGYEPSPSDGGLLVQAYSFLGREDLILKFRPDAFGRFECPVLQADGLQAVVDAVGDSQIVMINEAHHAPYHRWVIGELAARLGEDFTVFSAETFSPDSTTEALNAGPLMSLGFYSREPIFGRQLRRLIEQDYRFAAYEQNGDQAQLDDSASWQERIVEREESQALNFIANVLETYPEQRVLVHVGYAHLHEVGSPSGEDHTRWFAARLREKTGLNPLTISQTACRIPDSEEGVSLAQSALVDASETAHARVPGAVDLFLGRPSLTLTDGRPDWRYAIGDQAVAVPVQMLPVDERVIIEARAPGESLEFIPTERLMLYPGETLPLLLPVGEWVLTAWTPEGPYGDPVTIQVPSAD